MGITRRFGALVCFLVSGLAFGHGTGDAGPNYVHIKAADKYERTKIVNLGVSIEAVRSDSIYGLASDSVLKAVKKSDLKLLETFRVKDRQSPLDFPSEDARFHNYAEMTQALDTIVAAHSNIMRKYSIGKTIEGRDIWCVQINTSTQTLKSNGDAVSLKPGAIFMGNHHAREHLSAEIPLMFLEYLGKNYGVDRDITRLVDSRDTYIIPMVNPDGVEYDIATGEYQWQRKNMRRNANGTVGVDLNRNYGYMWNHGGASTNPSSDIYMGTAPFSEPETQAIKTFVESRSNLKVLLSFHTFSELVLYPWGHKYEPIEKVADHTTFEAMAKKMAAWNGYTPQQSSDLYIASGDTTDWAYGALGIFAFTFELSPRDQWSGGGFYPGVGVIDQVFEANLKPALYLMELADDPHRASLKRDDRLMWLE